MNTMGLYGYAFLDLGDHYACTDKQPLLLSSHPFQTAICRTKK